MTTLRIIYDVPGWAFHHKASALAKYAPADFAVSLASLRGGPALDTPEELEEAATALGVEPVDIVLLLTATKTKAVREVLRRRGWPTKLVAAWTDGLPRRLLTFLGLYAEADAWIICNQAYWEALGRLPRTYLIANGVDLEIFNIQRPPEQRAPKVLWTGSEHHRRLKGYDDCILPLQKSLYAQGIPCEPLLVDSRGPHKRTPAQMAEWYNSGTVLVCASASEGTPNPALEAAACGCTVVSTRVGNMPELVQHDVNGYLVDRTVDALLRAVEGACANYPRLSRAMQSTIRDWSWAQRGDDYFRVFRELLTPASPPVARPDLTQEVTVYVTTVGAATFEACLDRLRQQDCSFKLEIIDHVAGMNVAFQRMLDECRTPYYVQVDEDMLLYPHAVRSLHEKLAAAGPDVALAVADLYDVHLERCILGVKIFRHEVVRHYPFDATDSFEKSQLERLGRDGYRIVATVPGATPVAGQTLGLHGAEWTVPAIYERYATLERRRRRHPDRMQWFTEYPALFLERYLHDPSAENFFALMGVIAGARANATGEAQAKDFRNYETLPGLQPLYKFLEELERAT